MPQPNYNAKRTFSILFQCFLAIAVLYLLIKPIFHSDKIAYVTAGKILEEYKGAKEAKGAYQTKTKVWQQNIETLTNEVKGNIQKYEKAIATSSKSEQDMAHELIKVKQKQLADYQRGIQENANQEDAKLTGAVISQINNFLTAYGKKHHYRLILIANQSGAIAYAEDGMDITDDVIKDLNSGYAGTSK